MVLKSSIVILAASLLGCEGMGPKEPRLKKMMAEDEATSANSKGINFGLPPTTVPGSDGGDGSNPTVPGSGGSGSDSGRNGGSDGNGGSNGGIMGLKFYCSKDTSKQMKTDMHKAMGVSLKLY